MKWENLTLLDSYKKLQDAAVVEQLLTEHAICSCFDTQGLSFSACVFQKGELICSPLNPAEDILFLISGSAQMYDLREDGTKLPVAIIADEAINGELEFITGCPSGRWRLIQPFLPDS